MIRCLHRCAGLSSKLFKGTNVRTLAMKKSKNSGATFGGSMHQTKIGQFFSENPARKPDSKSNKRQSGDRAEVEEENKKTPEKPVREPESKRIKRQSGDRVELQEETKKTPTPSPVKDAAKDKERPTVPSSKGWDPDYNPAKNKYHPIDDASWTKDQR